MGDIKNELISVLVPVYNVELYLKKCLDSILNQTYENIEVVIVDDGSNDKSKQICDDYKKKDKRVKVIHKKNEGVAQARNIAISNSNGKYLTFVDSDDYILEDYVEYLYNTLIRNDADIVNCNFEYMYENNSKDIEIENKREELIIFNQKEALENLLYQRELDVSPWAKLYKREMFENVRFPVGKIYEDFGTFYKNIFNAQKIIYSNQKKYKYLIRGSSTTGRKFKKQDFDMIELSKNMKRDILLVYPELEKAVNSRIINMDFYFIRRIDKKAFFSEYKNIKNEIKELRRNVLKDRNIKLKVRIGIYISYINVDLIKYVYDFVKKMKFTGLSNYITKYKG